MIMTICAVILGLWIYNKFIAPELGNKEENKKEEKENSKTKKETK